MQGNTVFLSDGRKLSYCEYGNKQGIPVFLFHGTPGSRIWFIEDDEIARSLGIYLIATDRPGYGLSDKQANRQLMDWAADIEELADILNITKFSVFGVSGGGAYALVVSYLLPHRTELCLLVSTATPFLNGKASKDMSKVNRLAFFLSKYFPWLLKIVNKSQKKLIDKNPDKYKAALKKGGNHLSNWDNRMLLNEEILNTSILHSKEAFRQGVDEVLYESNLLSKDWGFSLEDVKVPIKIWHGEKDTLSPISEVKNMVSRLLYVETFYIEKGGHFLTEDEDLWKSMLESISFNHKENLVQS